jgi:hypothetical protein
MGKSCQCANGTRKTLGSLHLRSQARHARRASMGALAYNSYSDVAAEKIRVNAYWSTVQAQWNACAGNATDATGQQLSNDVATWYSAWSAFAATGETNLAILPDDNEWNTTQQYETQLAALVQRINAYCGSGLPAITSTGNAPAGPNLNTIAGEVTAVIVVLGIAVILFELAPVIALAVDELTD